MCNSRNGLRNMGKYTLRQTPYLDLANIVGIGQFTHLCWEQMS